MNRTKQTKKDPPPGGPKDSPCRGCPDAATCDKTPCDSFTYWFSIRWTDARIVGWYMACKNAVRQGRPLPPSPF